MNAIWVIRLLSFLIISFTIFSCSSIEKRKHRKGYHIELFSRKSKETPVVNKGDELSQLPGGPNALDEYKTVEKQLNPISDNTKITTPSKQKSKKLSKKIKVKKAQSVLSENKQRRKRFDSPEEALDDDYSIWLGKVFLTFVLGIAVLALIFGLVQIAIAMGSGLAFLIPTSLLSVFGSSYLYARLWAGKRKENKKKFGNKMLSWWGVFALIALISFIAAEIVVSTWSFT